MPNGLTYADAVELLAGPTPLGRAADNLLGGALSLATAGGSDAKAEAVRLGRLVLGRITETVRGPGRYDRSVRPQAAQGVLVVGDSLDFDRGAHGPPVTQCLSAAG
jgi:NACHT conflict system protein